MLQVLPFFIILRPRPRTYVSTSPLLLQLHQQQQLLSIINIINSANHHLQHAKLRIQLQQLTSHAAYERSGRPPKRLAAKRPCMRLWPSVDISKVRRKQSTRKERFLTSRFLRVEYMHTSAPSGLCQWHEAWMLPTANGEPLSTPRPRGYSSRYCDCCPRATIISYCAWSKEENVESKR